MYLLTIGRVYCFVNFIKIGEKMKKLVILAIVVALIVIFALPTALFADSHVKGNGMPAAHGRSGSEFGPWVSNTVQCDFCGFVDHVRGYRGPSK